METFRFKNFGVHSDAKKFRKLVQSYLKKFPPHHSLHDQISRACLSIILNIAEGSAKGSDKEFKRFMGMAIASVNEVVAGFDLACDDALINTADLQVIEDAAGNVARQIGGFIRKLAFDVKSQKLRVKS